SHDLRTPLALVIGYTEKLMKAPRRTAVELRELDIVARNARASLGHVNDLLDVSRLAAGAMPLEYSDTDLASLVRLVGGQFDVVAEETQLRYQLDIADGVRAEVDAEKIGRVLLNLLTNAFKFTTAGGVVRCALRAEGAEAVLEVADSGPGIPVDKREVVFERFRQLDGGDGRRFAGTGLGLAIARDFTELHRGSIEIGEAPEGGALFMVRVPVRAPEGTPVRAMPAPLPSLVPNGLPSSELRRRDEVPAAAQGTRPLVLVVEDNPEMN
ncbi:multi-sensor signal transduction histidine kinase, partial [mine drainage metagenome]